MYTNYEKLKFSLPWQSMKNSKKRQEGREAQIQENGHHAPSSFDLCGLTEDFKCQSKSNTCTPVLRTCTIS